MQRDAKTGLEFVRPQGGKSCHVEQKERDCCHAHRTANVLDDGLADTHSVDMPQERRVATIWVVDDEVGVMFALSEILKGQGYTVIPVQEALRAAEVCQTYPDPIDLLITDIVMPGINGLALAKQLQPMRLGHEAPLHLWVWGHRATGSGTPCESASSADAAKQCKPIPSQLLRLFINTRPHILFFVVENGQILRARVPKMILICP